MRDPNRINLYLDTLREYWEANPDMRLGQILANMVYMVKGSDATLQQTFNLEDSVLLEGLDRLKDLQEKARQRAVEARGECVQPGCDKPRMDTSPREEGSPQD